MVQNLDISWPEFFSGIQQASESIAAAGSAADSLSAYDCIFAYSYFEYLGFSLLTPIFSVVVPLLAVSLLSMLKHVVQVRAGEGGLDPYQANHYKTLTGVATLVLLFQFYPNVVQDMLDAFACDEYARDNDFTAAYIQKDKRELCDTSTHKLFKLLCFAGLFVYGFGIPLFNLAVLVCHRAPILATAQDPEADAAIRQQYGFLYVAYKPQYFWWEAVLNLRKFGAFVPLASLVCSHSPNSDLLQHLRLSSRWRRGSTKCS